MRSFGERLDEEALNLSGVQTIIRTRREAWKDRSTKVDSEIYSKLSSVQAKSGRLESYPVAPAVFQPKSPKGDKVTNYTVVMR